MPRWSSEQLAEYERRQSKANLSVDSARKNSKLELYLGDESLEAKEIQRPTGQKFLVRIISVRKRLLDESNLCEKYHEDLCRYAGILPSDAPQFCHTEVIQRKANKHEAEHTEILVYAPQT